MRMKEKKDNSKNIDHKNSINLSYHLNDGKKNISKWYIDLFTLVAISNVKKSKPYKFSIFKIVTIKNI